ncbi:MAG: BLUF domain-containing protein [Bacterioplanes sp.]|nr:BLUF domain-containing protein [Bacterioplanes sp.]
MSHLIRLVYASKATFKTNNDSDGAVLDLRIGRILTQSRANNARRKVGGVLYYGNGHFFQCLEGDSVTVRALYDQICTDSRHKDAVILVDEPIETRLFSEWTMKYIPAEKQIRSFLLNQGYRHFTPFEFTPEMVTRMVNYLHQVQVNHTVESQLQSNTNPNPSLWQKIKAKFHGA